MNKGAESDLCSLTPQLCILHLRSETLSSFQLGQLGDRIISPCLPCRPSPLDTHSPPSLQQTRVPFHGEDPGLGLREAGGQELGTWRQPALFPLLPHLWG